SSRRRHTIFSRDWSSDVCSSDLTVLLVLAIQEIQPARESCTELLSPFREHSVCMHSAKPHYMQSSCMDCSPRGIIQSFPSQSQEDPCQFAVRMVGKNCCGGRSANL